MQQYKYTAVNLQKQKFSGTFIANDEHDLAVQLAKQNLFLVSATPYSGKTPSSFFTMGTGKVSMQELTMFCNQFSVMLNAGIPILEALDSLRQQPFSTFFKNILNVVYEDVKGGAMLSKAIEKHKKIFPSFFCSMLYVGEAGGNLAAVFKELSNFYDKDAKLKKKTKSAFSYPIILAVMTVGIVILMLLLIVPTFKDTLGGMDVKPTGLTAVIFGMSDFLINSGAYLLAGIVAVVLGVYIFNKTEEGAQFFDMLKLKIPLINKIQTDTTTARFARSFSLLISSGMDIVGALESVSVIMTNRVMAAKYKKVVEDVKHGMLLSTAFQKYNMFPQILTQMVAIGEKSGTLSEVLNSTCDYFDDEVENTVTSATAKIQPIMLIIMGIVIGGMFIAVYSPIISIMTQVM